MPVLEANNPVKLGGFVAVYRMSFDVEDKKKFGILGPNGAG